MPRKRLGAEQIVTKLRQIEVMQGQSKSIAAARKEAGITEQTQRRMLEWRDLLQSEGSSNGHRELARPLQHPTAAFCARIQAAGAAHHRATDATARRHAKHALASQLAWYKKSVRSLPV